MKALTGAGVITTSLAALLAGGGGVALAQSAAGAVRQTARGSGSWAPREAPTSAPYRALTTDDPEPIGRATAFGLLLGTAQGASVDRALVERAVADRSPTVKAAGFNAMWLRQVPDYLPFMLRKLHDETDPLTRLGAAEALRNVVPSNPSVVDAVSVRLALETDPQVRQQMSAALVQMKAFGLTVKKPGR